MYGSFVRFALWLVVLGFGLAACGDTADPCDYNEADDVGNGSASEMTLFMLDKKTQTVCGNVDGGHYDALQKLVDVDRYRVTVGGTGELVIHIDPMKGVESLDGIRVQIFDTAVNPRLYAEGAFDQSYDHGAFITVLPPGDYDVIVAAAAAGDITSGQVAYRLRFTPDPSLQCKAETKASFTEALEPGNDAVSADFTKEPSFVMGPGMAETTKLTLGGGHHYLVSGAAQAGAAEGEYVDNDVYAVKTGDGVNELTVRLDWNGTGADLDYALLDATTLVPAGLGVTTTKTSGELATFAVLPKTAYLLWVGAFQGSTGETPYGATVCAAHYTP
jgi:hypothetical protein